MNANGDLTLVYHHSETLPIQATIALRGQLRAHVPVGLPVRMVVCPHPSMRLLILQLFGGAGLPSSEESSPFIRAFGFALGLERVRSSI